MNFPSEWLEFFGLLQSNDVEFVIVGAYALAANGRPRASQDIDILVNPTADNARRLARALREFGYPELADAAGTEFATPAKMASLGRPPLEIDIMNAIDGVSFDQAAAGALRDVSCGIELRFLGMRELVANKSATGRTKDKLDLELLREAGLLDEREEHSLTKRKSLIEKITRQGNPLEAGTPCPVVALEDFFDGNRDLGSIGCNLIDHPGTDVFYDVLRDVRSRADVQDVLVEIYEVVEGDDAWPFSERVYIITSADADMVRDWLAPLEPNEIADGWLGDAPPAAPTIEPGMRVLAAWWD